MATGQDRSGLRLGWLNRGWCSPGACPDRRCDWSCFSHKADVPQMRARLNQNRSPLGRELVLLWSRLPVHRSMDPCVLEALRATRPLNPLASPSWRPCRTTIDLLMLAPLSASERCAGGQAAGGPAESARPASRKAHQPPSRSLASTENRKTSLRMKAAMPWSRTASTNTAATTKPAPTSAFDQL